VAVGLVEFAEIVSIEAGKNYTARACGAEMSDSKWQGWIEFVPLGGGEPIRSSRETTQPNRQDTEYWATGLTPVYLEGALRRALRPPIRSPAPGVAPPRAVLDPFSVYRRGEAWLRRQLSALAAWHLINIIRRHELSVENSAALDARTPAQLIELIIDAVRKTQTVG
jgi:hypothetical protein